MLDCWHDAEEPPEQAIGYTMDNTQAREPPLLNTQAREPPLLSLPSFATLSWLDDVLDPWLYLHLDGD